MLTVVAAVLLAANKVLVVANSSNAASPCCTGCEACLIRTNALGINTLLVAIAGCLCKPCCGCLLRRARARWKRLDEFAAQLEESGEPAAPPEAAPIEFDVVIACGGAGSEPELCRMASLLAAKLRLQGLHVSAPAASATATASASTTPALQHHAAWRGSEPSSPLHVGGSSALINHGDARSAAELAARTRVFVVMWSAGSIAALASLDAASPCDERLLEARVALALKAYRGARYEVIPVLVGAPTRWSSFWSSNEPRFRPIDMGNASRCANVAVGAVEARVVELLEAAGVPPMPAANDGEEEEEERLDEPASVERVVSTVLSIPGAPIEGVQSVALLRTTTVIVETSVLLSRRQAAMQAAVEGEAGHA